MSYTQNLTANTTQAPDISRRTFLKGAACAAGLFALGGALPGWLSPSLAWADEPQVIGETLGSQLHDCVVRMRPRGFMCTAGVHNDGVVKGNACWLYHMGTSSKHVLWYHSDMNAYTIRTLSNFEENEYASNSIWDIDGRSEDDGAVVHVWGNDHKGVESRFWTFERQSDSTYYIKNLNSELYLSLDNVEGDNNENKLVQCDDPLAWQIEIVGAGRYGDKTVSVDTWERYSSFAEGCRWMSFVGDKVRLCDLSIPGTHDAGACSTKNDTEPQTSAAKCQQDYFRAQLLMGTRCFDIRLDGGGPNHENANNPMIIHGGVDTLLKNGGNQLFSHLFDDLRVFLRDAPTECVLLLLSADEGKSAEGVTGTLHKYMTDYPSLFYDWGDGDPVPTLGQVRGKIVLMRRFKPTGTYEKTFKYGIDLTGWDVEFDTHKGLKRNYNVPCKAKEDQPYHVTVNVQDHYQTSASTKWEYIEGAFRDTKSKCGTRADFDPPQYALAINYTSCTVVNPFTSARILNEKLADSTYLNDMKTYPFMGIVMNNFTDARLSKLIYRRNYASSMDDQLTVAAGHRHVRRPASSDGEAASGAGEGGAAPSAEGTSLAPTGDATGTVAVAAAAVAAVAAGSAAIATKRAQE